MRTRQSGNVFLIILMAIVLFAALAFMISRGMRTQTTTTMSAREAELMAADILSHAQRLERAVSKLRQKGVSENDLDFTNSVVSGYTHTPALAASYGIFNVAGAKAAWQTPPAKSNDGSAWLITGGTCVPDVGTGGAGCASDTTSNEEILAVLPNLKIAVCEEINKKLGIAATPSGGTISSSKFTGSFPEGDAPSGVAGRNAACVSIGGNYIFYYTILAR